MTAYEKYDIIFEALQEKLAEEELTIEEANTLNDMAYEKYVVTEGEKSDVVDMLDDLKDKVEDGDITIPDDVVETLKGLLDDSAKKDDSEDKEDDKSAEKDEADEDDAE